MHLTAPSLLSMRRCREELVETERLDDLLSVPGASLLGLLLRGPLGIRMVALVNGLDFLWFVFAALPGLFLFDLLTFTFGLWWIRRWRRARAGRV